MSEFEQIFKDFQDYLAPRLDTYEQAIYLYILRHTRFIGCDATVIGLKSARRRMAIGIGEAGRPMSEGTAYEKLRSLKKKGCIELLDTTRDGRMIRLLLPSEIPGVVIPDQPTPPPDLETLDFFADKENRKRIVMREGHRCFYCLAELNDKNYVIEHVTSRPAGDNTYRNVVAACRQCNNRKGPAAAEEWLRTLYRENLLDAHAFQERFSNLEGLRTGKLKPPEAGL